MTKRSDDENAGAAAQVPHASARPRPSGIDLPPHENPYRAALHGSADAFFLFEVRRDADGHPVDFYFREMNGPAEAFVPRGREEWIGRPVFDFFALPEHRPLRDRMMRVATTGEASAGEHLVPYNGAELCVHCQLLPAAGDIVAIVHDLTEKQQAEEARRASEERWRHLLEADEAHVRDNARRYAAVFNSAFQFTGLLTADGLVLETNQAALAFAGARAEELAGRPFWEATWWQTHDAAKAQLRELTQRAARGDFVRLELEVVGRDGRHAVLDFSLTPVRDDGGRVLYLVPEGRDITEKKQLEESVQRAEKMEAIGRMAGGIAHDFNNLLNVISGFNEILATDVAGCPLDPLSASPNRAQVAVSEIRRAVDRAGLLIQQLLVVSRRQTLAPIVMDVNAVVRETRNMVKRAIGDGVDLSLRLEATNPHVHADPAKLEHVILNLAINARDAMPEGGTLTIATSNHWVDENHPLRASGAKPGPYLVLAVSDTGMGMAPSTRERIFEPFFTTKPRGKGTGLGLATVYGIVTQSDGVIDVDTELGRGSTFQVFLPSA